MKSAARDTSLVKIATYNINSVRLRLELACKLLRAENIDILCLQETKAEDAVFPHEAFRDTGYGHVYFSGEKSYNGVAIISRVPLTGVTSERFVNGDKRHIAARLPDGTELHNFYIPAGGDIPDPEENPKFGHKLKFCDAMTEWFSANRSRAGKMILVGDLNIAPLENDVWSHKQLLNVVSHTQVEVEKLGRLRDSLGWTDAAREFVPRDQKLYSWWSYRNRDWSKSDRGRRLDHIWITDPLKSSLKNCRILREMRGAEQPSDHVPVIAEFCL